MSLVSNFVKAEPQEDITYGESAIFDSDLVKTEPRDAEMFRTDFINNLNSLYGDVYNKSIGNHRRMKMENDIDIFYDLKCEVDNEENLSNYMHGEDLNQDVKPFISEPARQGAEMFGTDSSTYPNSMSDNKLYGDPGQMKMEDGIDIVYEDLKYGVENEGYFSYNISAQDSSQDVDPLLLDPATQLNLKSRPGEGSFRSNLLKDHLGVHIGEKPFHCELFAQSSTLKNHERRHTGDRPFHCDICSKSFTRSRDLKIHGICHTDERPFQCKTCSKSFTRSGDLKIHEKYHSGKKPFQCEVCSKSFTRRGDLKVHERTHTGERPFRCTVCQKSFTRGDTLKIHERSHTGNRPFKCGTCSISFTRRAGLKVHERIHTGEKPFQCTACPKTFRHISSLKYHERSHTGEKSVQC